MIGRAGNSRRFIGKSSAKNRKNGALPGYGLQVGLRYIFLPTASATFRQSAISFLNSVELIV
jgi:hypothetical protein